MGFGRMTNLANVSSTLDMSTQLPIDWYFNQEIYNAEIEALYKPIGYVGHELLVPNVGDYHVLDWMGNGKALVRSQDGVELLSNVCRHRQAIMLKGRGNAQSIVCPLHRWAYDLKGDLMGAPHFPQKPCLNLERKKLQNWHGLLFDTDKDIKQMYTMSPEVEKYINYNGYKYVSTMVDNIPCNWKTFIEVYLEDYHVVPFHPGLGNMVNCDELKWEFNEWYSVQTVGILQGMKKSGSKPYEKYQSEFLKSTDGKLPDHGAVWFLMFPNVMVEVYPHMLTISSVIPTGPESMLNIVEFYHPEEIADFEEELVESAHAAYRETADEDMEICIRMHEGRKALYLDGKNEVGPYQSPTEDGMQHFHQFIRNILKTKNII